jgi:hypothetical protein
MKKLSKTFLATALRLFGFVMVRSIRENEQQYSDDLLNRTAGHEETPEKGIHGD